ncbi:hypothetical protein LZ31DRAFT_614128 [Colletotrichum somersetense]|nr:hypothetical protein LZ31DRAFT_614128 [Colletotrichum somersetense]
MVGTSMATPLLAGCGAVLRQALKAFSKGLSDDAAIKWFGSRPNTEGPGAADPGSALLKALTINGAVPLGSGPIPDKHWRFGRVNLFAQNVVPEGGEWKTEFVVPDKCNRASLLGEVLCPRLKATMAYVDMEGDMLQNLVHISAQYWPADGSGPFIEKVNEGSLAKKEDNNVQQVVWKAIKPGKYSIAVRCARILQKQETGMFGVAWHVEKDVGLEA